MSCESRHRAIVTTLLTLAGLRDTVDADTVMDVGVANRRRRGGLPTPDAAVPVSLHADAQHALEITGHSDHTTPAWVVALIDRLHTAAERGNRRALLTMRWLTEGWEEVMPSLTWCDSAWLLTVNGVGIPIPSAGNALLTPRPPAAIGRRFAFPVRHAVIVTEVLDALIGIDTIPPAAVQAVTPSQVLRFLFDHPLVSFTELQSVLRAVCEMVPIVHDICTRLDTLSERSWIVNDCSLPYRLFAAAHGRKRFVAQDGVEAILHDVANAIGKRTGRSIDPPALCDPSPKVVQTITSLLQDRWTGIWTGMSNLDGRDLTALIHTWQLGGRSDAIEQIVQALAQILATQHMNNFRFSAIVAPIIAGVVPPPHGDALVAGLHVLFRGKDDWSAMTAGAVYAAMCQQQGHEPSVNGRDDLIRVGWVNQWTTWRFATWSSPLPLLAVGHEQALLPVLHAARDTDAWVHMIVDCIDAADTLAMVGGNPQALLAVLTDVLTGWSGAVDPQIVVRLAASPHGRAILADLPTVPPPPVRQGNDTFYTCRVLSHLVSPWWATAPPHLREWWETAIRHAAESRVSCFTALPPLYSAVEPQAAVIYPTPALVTCALANPAWATLAEAERQACLRHAVTDMGRCGWIHAILHAATDVARHDIWQAATAASVCSDEDARALWHLIASDVGRSA